MNTQKLKINLRDKYTLKDLFEKVVKAGTEITDIHISCGFPPYIRQKGNLIPLDLPSLTPEDVKFLLYQHFPEEKISKFEKNLSIEFCNKIGKLIKFRANLRKENNNISGIYRLLPDKIPTLESLNLPKSYEKLASKEKGLIIVTGQAKSGKTSTIAAIINFINNNKSKKITILDTSAEFIHSSKKSLIVHKEVGQDVENYIDGMNLSIAEGLDVLVIQEIENTDVMSLALETAQRDTLVIAGFYTTGAIKTLDTIIQLFPAAQKHNICEQLSRTLEGIISQSVEHEKGRQIKNEILIPTTGSRIFIKEGRTNHLESILKKQ